MELNLNPKGWTGLNEAQLYYFLWPLINQGGCQDKETIGPSQEIQCNLPRRAPNILGWQDKLCTVPWHGMILSFLPQSQGQQQWCHEMMSQNTDEGRTRDKEPGRIKIATVWRWNHLHQTLYWREHNIPCIQLLRLLVTLCLIEENTQSNIFSN